MLPTAIAAFTLADTGDASTALPGAARPSGSDDRPSGGTNLRFLAPAADSGRVAHHAGSALARGRYSPRRPTAGSSPSPASPITASRCTTPPNSSRARPVVRKCSTVTLAGFGKVAFLVGLKSSRSSRRADEAHGDQGGVVLDLDRKRGEAAVPRRGPEGGIEDRRARSAGAGPKILEPDAAKTLPAGRDRGADHLSTGRLHG